MSRKGIPEDLEYDPEHNRQRRIAAYLIGMAVNSLRDSRPDQKALADLIQKIALSQGIVAFDEWHHAPACPANNWSQMRLPVGPCNCGAARHQIR